MKHKYVLFDRDGTLIQHVHHLVDIEKVEIFPDVIPGLLEMMRKNYRFGIISNQSVIERGYATHDIVQAINAKIRDHLSQHGIQFDFILYCPHMSESMCECRKPNTALGLKAIVDYSIDPKSSYMVGDQLSDIQFGKNLEFMTIGVRNESLNGSFGDYYCRSLVEVAAFLS